jgi:peptidoglycan/LPS O-acetylase OafA/YrhL
VAAALRAALPFFFLLSAFLLYRPYVAARLLGSPRPSLRTFWLRRVLRIVPAYWVALTLLAIWPGLPGVFGSGGWRYYGFAYVYGQSYVDGGIVPAWTICVDMTFYLMLPLYAAALDSLWRRVGERRGLRVELVVLTAIFAAAVGYWLAALHRTGLTVPQVEVREWNLPANLDWFALGLALAVLSVHDQRRPTWLSRQLRRRWGVGLAWGAGAGLFAFLAADFFRLTQLQQHVLEGLACAAVFAPLVLATGRGRPQRVLANPRAMWLGLVAYGIYLYHGPIINQVQRLKPTGGHGGLGLYLVLVGVALPLSVVAGVVSYRIVERPFLRRKDAAVPGAGARPHRQPPASDGVELA